MPSKFLSWWLWHYQIKAFLWFVLGSPRNVFKLSRKFIHKTNVFRLSDRLNFIFSFVLSFLEWLMHLIRLRWWWILFHDWLGPEAICSVVLYFIMRGSSFVKFKIDWFIFSDRWDIIQLFNANKTISVRGSSIWDFVVAPDLWLFVKPTFVDFVFIRARFRLSFFVIYDLTRNWNSGLLQESPFAAAHAVLLRVAPFYPRCVLFSRPWQLSMILSVVIDIRCFLLFVLWWGNGWNWQPL